MKWTQYLRSYLSGCLLFPGLYTAGSDARKLQQSPFTILARKTEKKLCQPGWNLRKERTRSKIKKGLKTSVFKYCSSCWFTFETCIHGSEWKQFKVGGDIQQEKWRFEMLSEQEVRFLFKKLTRLFFFWSKIVSCLQSTQTISVSWLYTIKLEYLDKFTNPQENITYQISEWSWIYSNYDIDTEIEKIEQWKRRELWNTSLYL